MPRPASLVTIPPSSRGVCHVLDRRAPMFSVTTKTRAAGASTLDADVSAATTSTAPAFVTEQAVTSFAASAAIVQLVWQAFQNAAGGWADSVWLPLGIAIVLGLGLTAPLLNDRDRPVG